MVLPLLLPALVAAGLMALASSIGCRRPEPTVAETELQVAQLQATDAVLSAFERKSDVGVELIGLKYGTSPSNALAIRSILFPSDAVWKSALSATSVEELRRYTNIALRPVSDRVSLAAAATGLSQAQVIDIGLAILSVEGHKSE